MKKLIIPVLMLSWVMLWALAPIASSVGQTEGGAPAELHIQSLKNPKRAVEVERGRKVKVILNDDRTYKGVLQSASDSMMRIDSLDFPYKDIRMVRVPGYGNLGAKISGLVVGLIGFIAFALGVVMILLGASAEPDSSSDGCSQAVAVFLLIFFGVIIGTIGAVFFLLGLITFMIGVLVGKAFKLDGKWKLGRSKSNAAPGA